MSAGFNATADRLLITTAIPAWTGGSIFSQQIWFKIDATTGGLQTIFARIRDDLTAYIFIGTLADLTLYFENSTGSSMSGPTLSTGTWYNLAYSYAPGVGSEFWLNNISLGVFGADVLAGTPERLELGGWRSVGGNRFNGSLSAEVSWTRDIDTAEVTAQSATATPVNPTNIYNATPMNTVSFGNDISTGGHPWTIAGTLNLTANPPGVSFPSAGGIPFPFLYNQNGAQTPIGGIS